MRAIYLAGVRIYGLIIRILSLFNDKARKWRDGRRGLLAYITDTVDRNRGSIWFHFASLGEFEQGRPVLEQLRKQWPDKQFVLTFFSPSGYEIRKNTPLADHVFYLPEDTPANARRFVEAINPELAIFTKYEYWPFYFRTLAAAGTPLYLVSAIFRPDQIFFRWYGGFFRETLQCVTYFFTQNQESLELLADIGITQASLAGDTRFDRVAGLPLQRKPIPEVEIFTADRPVLVAGSTWPADEAILAELHRQFPDWAVIIAPHEIQESHLTAIEKLFTKSIRFSTLSQLSTVTGQMSERPTVLIIDNIGMLSSLYAYGQTAYIGGGFGAGIHNTLEAATYGIPVIFGPNHQKFQEAVGLLACGGGFTVNSAESLAEVFHQLSDDDYRSRAGAAACRYVEEHAGATGIIIRHLIGK